eukprot:6195380-Pleurochrysis_carterae.AAC.3
MPDASGVYDLSASHYPWALTLSDCQTFAPHRTCSPPSPKLSLYAPSSVFAGVQRLSRRDARTPRHPYAHATKHVRTARSHVCFRCMQ